MTSYDQLWQHVLAELEQVYSEETYKELFEPLNSVHHVNNGTLFILTQNEYIKNRIQRLYSLKINEIVKNYTSEALRIRFILAEELSAEFDTVSPELDLVSRYRIGNLNGSFTFDNFVVGKSNMFAFRMAMKVADQPGAVANPLYIFGDVGLGKTHLTQAIGNYILDNDPNKKVLYVKADSFIEDFANLLRLKRMEDFHEKYRDIDVFLVDDIQIMGGANKTQMEFFKLFDILYQGNKQIVITSDKPASELKNIMTRLTSRFEVGLSVDIQIPDLEHRIEILKRKLSSETSQAGDVDFEVLNFIASSFVTNIRELEGAIKRVLFYALTNNTEITVETTQEALEPLLKTRRKSNLLNENNYDRIQSTVSDFYGISIEDLIGKKRHSKYVVPRHISMFLIKSQYNIPYKVIGSLFGDRDHSTVLAACEKIENELRQDKSLKLAVDTITKKLNMN
jgi:chromosomal replication initiator protein